MSKQNSLILGNGINLIFEDYFSSKRIAERIKKMLPIAYEYLGFENNVVFLDDLEKEFDFSNYSQGIENLLYDCIKFIISKRKNGYFKKLTKNNFFELMTLLKKVFINAMFVEENKIKSLIIPQSTIDKVLSFDSVYSLNYYEFWDSNGITIHLHGKINYREFNRDDFIIDETRKDYDLDHSFSIDEFMDRIFHFPIRNMEDLIMLPINYNLDKEQAHEFQIKNKVYGFLVYPDFEKKVSNNIYSRLESLDKISLFGVSPLGDSLLLKKLSNISSVTIYVHGIDLNKKEIKAWEKLIPHAVLLDSTKFENN